MTSEHQLTVRFGASEISDPRLSARVTQRMNSHSIAELIVPNDVLVSARPDYRAAVEIFASVEGQDHQMFTGFVDSAIPEGSNTRLSLVTQTKFMEESALGGLGYRRADPREMMWALTRMGGYQSEKITIEGWEPGPTEVFEVAAAVEGITLSQPVALGRVRLLSGGTVSRFSDGLGPEELEGIYASGPAWALVTCTAKTLLGAEEEGVRELDFALAWLTARAHYSSVSLPSRQPRLYKRQWTLSQVLRKDAVVVRGLSTGRTWLRALQDIPSRPPLPTHEITDIELPVLPPDISVQLREAVNSWRRAAEATNLLESVVAINDALEFYVSNVSFPRLFSPSELEYIRNNATSGLIGEQKKRVSEVVGNMLNAPSHMMKLRKALEENRVPYTVKELQLLKKVRGARNELVHGRYRKAPPEEDIRYAIAIVNRMLVHAVSKCNRAI